MNILEVKKVGELDHTIQTIMKNLKFNKDEIKLNGSSSLKCNKYFGDYDFFTNITERINNKTLYNRVNKVLKWINKNNNLYLIEFKIQNDIGNKFKYTVREKLPSFKQFEEEIKNLDFIKIDFVLYIENKFIECSIIYSFKKNIKTPNEFINDIKKDIDEYKKEGNYFKILKRQFTIEKISDNEDNMRKILNILNSEIGAKYQLKSNLEALKLVHEFYDDQMTDKRILLNLRELSLKPDLNLINNYINKFNKEINDEVKEYL